MITRQLIILQAVLLLGLGAVFLLPHHGGVGPAGIAMTLPKEFDGWKGTDVPIAKEELAGLAADTLFVRQTYKNRIGDQIYVSIVLSGEDMVNSIHRPERCLSAQGWTVERSARMRLPLAGDGQRSVEVTRLTSVRQGRAKEGGKTIGIKNLNYYWFIGSRDQTASHWTRTFIDSKDRVLNGENQRWAYVTVAATVMDNLEPGGRDEADTMKMVETFIGEVASRFQKPGAESLDDSTPRATAPSDAPETPGI